MAHALHLRLVVRLAFVLTLVVAASVQAQTVSAAPELAAIYTVASTPPTLPIGNVVSVAVSITNTGTATWNSSGANLVDLSYHWYDTTGKAVVWDGLRSPLSANVPPTGTIAATAQVVPPTAAGTYLLRFALVKEGVGWFDPEAAAHTVAVVSPFQVSFGQVTPPASFVAGGTYTIAVPVTNSGTSIWNATGANPIQLSYHWLDPAGNGVVWDGVRTPLGADFAPGTTRTISATIVAPINAGTYSLALDMVKEGMAWFGQWSRVPMTAQPPTYKASYTLGATTNAYIAESRTLPVTIGNAGNVPWSSLGTNPVKLSYHWFDASGTKVVNWDGVRTLLPTNVDPGANTTLQMAVVMPKLPGSYLLQVDLVREGMAWFSTLGSAPASVSFMVITGLGASWGGDTAPTSMTNNSGYPASLTVTNSGQRAWASGGANPVQLAYHVYGSGGDVVVWDGNRSALPKDVAPGETVTINAVAYAPGSSGSYSVKWDLVQEGVSWFSAYGIATKNDPLQVFPGVTIYGKGWGHGVGLSQWGAQGWATGATGPALTADQIVTRYFPGATFGPVPTKPLHVLLSSPSTGCNARSIYNIAQMRSAGGIRVVKWWSPSTVILNASPGQTVRVFMSGSTLQIMDEWSGRILYSGAETIGIVPLDATKPITIDQKNRSYRGAFAVESAGYLSLRVVNELGWDDYARGSVPSEMLMGWHINAYESQAYSAKSYAAWRQSSNGSRLWDVRDDTSDQCYGGVSAETPIANDAVTATAGRMLVYNGAPIRAYYSSSNGGATEPNGCVWNVVRDSSGRYSCGSSDPYLQAVPDPADVAAVGPSGPNPQRAWTVTLASWQIESAVSRSGYYIGSFISLDLSNVGPGGHVISVRVRGTGGSVELAADSFLRGKLGLKSTMARTAPF